MSVGVWAVYLTQGVIFEHPKKEEICKKEAGRKNRCSKVNKGEGRGLSEEKFCYRGPSKEEWYAKEVVCKWSAFLDSAVKKNIVVEICDHFVQKQIVGTDTAERFRSRKTEYWF